MHVYAEMVLSCLSKIYGGCSGIGNTGRHLPNYPIMLNPRVVFTAFTILTTTVSLAQEKDSVLLKQLDNVVITGTKTERKLGNVAIPTQVITAQMIKATGSLKLQDILQEQTGL